MWLIHFIVVDGIIINILLLSAPLIASVIFWSIALAIKLEVYSLMFIPPLAVVSIVSLFLNILLFIHIYLQYRYYNNTESDQTEEIELPEV